MSVVGAPKRRRFNPHNPAEKRTQPLLGQKDGRNLHSVKKKRKPHKSCQKKHANPNPAEKSHQHPLGEKKPRQPPLSDKNPVKVQFGEKRKRVIPYLVKEMRQPPLGEKNAPTLNPVEKLC